MAWLKMTRQDMSRRLCLSRDTLPQNLSLQASKNEWEKKNHLRELLWKNQNRRLEIRNTTQCQCLSLHLDKPGSFRRSLNYDFSSRINKLLLLVFS